MKLWCGATGGCRMERKLVINLYAVMHDPRVFRDPTHFDPEANFPTDDPKVQNRSLENFVPFGFGLWRVTRTQRAIAILCRNLATF